jgi:serine O-acetyltransferase
MIKSKTDYLYYLKRDCEARGIKKQNFIDNIKELILPNETLKFQKNLRKVEYYINCKKGILNKIYFTFINYRFRKHSMKLGFSIPPNVFGPGLCILHYGTIVVNSRARIGENCRMEVCVNIGASGGNPSAPKIGNNVYIAPGVKIYGDIQIGNNIAIGANSSVNKSFIEDGIMIAGSPAKKIKPIDIKRIISHC